MGFKEKVYKLTAQIPKGKVSSYKELSHALNCKAYRAVGSVLNKNNNLKVPCHRVINHSGKLGGFRTGLKNKIKLLKKENVIIQNNKIDRKFFYKFK